MQWFTYYDDPPKFIEVPLKRVKEILALNEKKKYPEDLIEHLVVEEKQPDYENVVGQDSLHRFDRKKKGKKSKKKGTKKFFKPKKN